MSRHTPEEIAAAESVTNWFRDNVVGPHILPHSAAKALTERILAASESAKPQHVFEVVDASDEERYYTLGMFFDRNEAMSLLDCDEPPYNDDDPESAVIEIRERPVGFHPHKFKTIAARTWVRNYSDDDDGKWTAQPIRHKEAPTP
jgi:hypothetical protein